MRGNGQNQHIIQPLISFQGRRPAADPVDHWLSAYRPGETTAKSAHRLRTDIAERWYSFGKPFLGELEQQTRDAADACHEQHAQNPVPAGTSPIHQAYPRAEEAYGQK